MVHWKAYSIADHEGMPKVLKIKERNATLYLDSYWNVGVDYHYKNQVSGKENGEDSEEDSEYESESDSEI